MPRELSTPSKTPLVVLDVKMRVISANSAFYRFFGGEPKTRSGGRSAKRKPVILMFLLSEVWWRKSRTRPASWTMRRIEIELPPINERILVLTIREIRGAVGMQGNILVAVEDVTERKKAERDLEAAKAAAEQANLGKSRFLAAASHDSASATSNVATLERLSWRGK